MSETKKPEGAMRVDTGLIRQLAEMLSENDLSEIEVEDGDRKIVVKRQLSAAPVHAAPPAAPASAPGTASPAPQAETSAEENAADHPGAVKSPMVGTVYLAGEPGAKPFVSVGDKVEAGQTLLIIEAMKVMNPITSPRAGTVKAVLAQDAQPVEFDQPLAIVE